MKFQEVFDIAEIRIMIMEKLSGSDLTSLARVSRDLKGQSLPHLYKSIQISLYLNGGDNGQGYLTIAQLRFESLINSLAIPEHSLLVRNLRVDITDEEEPEVEEESFVEVGLFEHVWERHQLLVQYECITEVMIKMKCLRRFAWSVSFGLPECIASCLSKLSTLQSLYSSTPVDHLSSKSLTTLQNICAYPTSLCITNIRSYNEIKSILCSDNYLRLHLCFSQNHDIRRRIQQVWTAKASKGHSLPRIRNLSRLQSLAIKDCPISLEGLFEWSSGLCALVNLELVNCIGQEAVFRLIGSQIKKLVVRTTDITSITEFLATSSSSLRVLSLDLIGLPNHMPEELLYGISRFGKTLRWLHIDGCQQDFQVNPVGWSRKKWRNFAIHFRDLRALGVRIKHEPLGLKLEDLSHPRLDKLECIEVLGSEIVSRAYFETLLHNYWSEYLHRTRDLAMIEVYPPLRFLKHSNRIFKVTFLPGISPDGQSNTKRVTLNPHNFRDRLCFEEYGPFNILVEPHVRWIG